MTGPKLIDHVTWDHNPEEHNLEDGALALERLEQELLSDNDEYVAATAMPPPTSIFFPSVPGGRAGVGRGSASRAFGDDNPIVHRPREKKLEISRGKRKHG